ncbi:5'-nucleotidase, lipoprotein e(P4) family [Pseudomonas salmasensis]|uniref:5'-nucleotidase, lipoprotein e(P4) family n=1 Tax=Pseudomonas salmasensis TaxID=2745514 RepID=UPI0016452AC8|nr:HAD family acid phosphatase [Pseudomonas salmasensis]QXH79280.1 acid phosphatase [Pseudomonas salmasensis]
MRNLFFASLCLFTTALAGCQQHPPANDQLDAVLWTQTSIEHELIYRQLFANATRQLDVALADPSWDALPFAPRNLAGLPPAVVVDIDETLLDNVPLNARDIINNQVYSYDRWNTWVEQAKAQALPGSVAFLQAARQKGIQVYYLTNREHSQVAATAKNLRLRGFPIESDAQILAASTPTGHCESAGYGKNCRRQWVANHARVLLMAGDSLGDFVQAEHNTLDAQRKAVEPYVNWLGQRWFLLPNPSYGNWYSAPYGDDERLPFAHKRRLKQQALLLQQEG